MESTTEPKQKAEKNSTRARLIDEIDSDGWWCPPAEACEESREASKRDPPPVISLAGCKSQQYNDGVQPLYEAGGVARSLPTSCRFQRYAMKCLPILLSHANVTSIFCRSGGVAQSLPTSCGLEKYQKKHAANLVEWRRAYLPVADSNNMP